MQSINIKTIKWIKALKNLILIVIKSATLMFHALWQSSDFVTKNNHYDSNNFMYFIYPDTCKTNQLIIKISTGINR